MPLDCPRDKSGMNWLLVILVIETFIKKLQPLNYAFVFSSSWEAVLTGFAHCG